MFVGHKGIENGMNNVNSNVGMNFDRIMANLPPAKSDGEIEAEYGSMLDRAMDLYRRAMRQSKIQNAARTATELVVSLKRKLRSGLNNFVEWSDSLVPAFDKRNSAFLARGAAAQNQPVAFTKEGYGCLLSISIEDVLPDSATMRISLLANDGRRLRPFYLTVMDVDTNTFHLERKMIAVGDAVLKGMKAGNYILVAIHGEDVVTLKQRIE